MKPLLNKLSIALNSIQRMTPEDSAQARLLVFREAGRMRGKTKSERKAESSRRNGTKGGRPKTIAELIQDANNDLYPSIEIKVIDDVEAITNEALKLMKGDKYPKTPTNHYIRSPLTGLRFCFIHPIHCKKTGCVRGIASSIAVS